MQYTLALPAPQAGNGKPINNDDVLGIPIGPSGSSGSIYGSETLLGNGDNPVNKENSAIVKNYPTVPGQEADADIGLFLDFAAVDDAQPIRGSNGATDPGPRMYTASDCATICHSAADQTISRHI